MRVCRFLPSDVGIKTFNLYFFNPNILFEITFLTTTIFQDSNKNIKIFLFQSFEIKICASKFMNRY